VLSVWRFKRERADLSVKGFLYALAKLGGHLGRKHDKARGGWYCGEAGRSYNYLWKARPWLACSDVNKPEARCPCYAANTTFPLQLS